MRRLVAPPVEARPDKRDVVVFSVIAGELVLRLGRGFGLDWEAHDIESPLEAVAAGDDEVKGHPAEASDDTLRCLWTKACHEAEGRVHVCLID